MGNSASKSTISKSVNKTANKSTTFDQNFGREIMKNIELKESPFISTQKEASTHSNLSKRMELDKRTEGTVSWDDFSLIFHENGANRIKLEDKSKIDEIKKYFELPNKLTK